MDFGDGIGLNVGWGKTTIRRRVWVGAFRRLPDHAPCNDMDQATRGETGRSSMIFNRFRSKANSSVAPSRQRRRTSGRPTTISSEVIIEGHLVTNGEIQIDGTINGDVRARVCVVDAN